MSGVLTGSAALGDWRTDAPGVHRVGYKIISVPLRNGRPTGEYDDFTTGFVTPEGEVWGRLVGVTAAKDGALIVTDDGSGSVWRVSYQG